MGLDADDELVVVGVFQHCVGGVFELDSDFRLGFAQGCYRELLSVLPEVIYWVPFPDFKMKGTPSQRAFFT